jgi:hypothetical protein
MPIFSRQELRLVLLDVKEYNQNLPVREAWVWKCGKDHWEFHFGDFYWHGSADNAYDARSRGWTAYLANAGVEGYAR